MRILTKLIYCLVVASLLYSNPFRFARAETISFANCRLGVGGVTSNVVGYDLEQLNMGLYIDWNLRTGSPTGLPSDIDYINTIRVHQDKVGGWDSDYVDPPSYTVTPDLTTVANIVTAGTPGRIWRIGNEIERRDWNGGGQDEMTPELYATAYHDIRAVIKTADPTARVAIGSVIEATPLRLAYLDRVWNSYLSQYGYPMGDDIDVWIVHGFILREVRNSWGAEIPAGFDNTDADPNNNYDPTDGLLYGFNTSQVYAAHHNIAYFKQFMEDLRLWMANHGERNKPLIITEFGVLYDVGSTNTNNYMDASFDYLFSATDATTGFPADENRLVQRWVWFSLNAEFYNGNLYDPDTKTLTSLGTNWKNYVSNAAKPLASQAQRNLLAANLRTEPNPAYVASGESINITLKVDIANSGNTSTTTGNNIKVSFWDGDPNDSDSNRIGSIQTINDLPGCSRFTTVEVTWPRSAGTYTWYVKIDSINGETNANDNIASHTFSVIEGGPAPGDNAVYLPLIMKNTLN